MEVRREGRLARWDGAQQDEGALPGAESSKRVLARHYSYKQYRGIHDDSSEGVSCLLGRPRRMRPDVEFARFSHRTARVTCRSRRLHDQTGSDAGTTATLTMRA